MCEITLGLCWVLMNMVFLMNDKKLFTLLYCTCCHSLGRAGVMRPGIHSTMELQCGQETNSCPGWLWYTDHDRNFYYDTILLTSPLYYDWSLSVRLMLEWCETLSNHPLIKHFDYNWSGLPYCLWCFIWLVMSVSWLFIHKYKSWPLLGWFVNNWLPWRLIRTITWPLLVTGPGWTCCYSSKTCVEIPRVENYEVAGLRLVMTGILQGGCLWVQKTSE